MRSLKLTLFLLIAGIVMVSVQSGVSSQSQDKPKPKPDALMLGCSIVDPIDDCIQELFSKADFRFGMTRVPTRRSHMSYFAPSTQKEAAAVKELDGAGWQMGFYLAGRSILGEKPAANTFFEYGHKHPVIGGPVAITGTLNRKTIEHIREELPEPAELWDQGQKAMRAFETSERYEFFVGNWKVEARPIRARESCLKCHNNDDKTEVIDLNHAPSKTPIKVGDALGVAMYAYTKKQ